MKQLFKRLFKTPAFRMMICALAATYIRFVYYTSRIRVEIDPAALPYANGSLPAVFAFWHGRLLMMPMVCPPKRKIHVLISTHRDGAMISRAMEHFGVGTVWGSTTRGGAKGAKSAVKALQLGESVVVTPDGPRGPAMQVQPGVLAIARLAQVPVVPATYSSTRHKRMRSWDRFMLALPFGTLHYKVGAPMMNVDKDSLERSMVKLTEEVDAG